MARRNDDDYDDEDRDRRPPKKSSSNTWIILGVIGGVLLLSVVGCVGVIGWGVFKASKAINETFQMVGGYGAGETFFEDLRLGRTQIAYDSTSANFKSSQSKAQFDQFLAKNPLLTKHTTHINTQPFNGTAGNGPTNKLTLIYRLSMTPDLDDDDAMDPDIDPVPPPVTKGQGKMKTPPMPTRPSPKKPKADPALADISVTLTLINDNGIWKVDQITIP